MNTCAIRSLCRLFPLLTALVAACPVQAATISWDAVQTIAGDGDVSSNGAAVAAYNLNGGATTVNGVSFQPFAAVWAGSGGSATVGDFTLSGGNNVAASNASSTAPIYTGLSLDYRELVGSAATWIWFPLDLAMGGLTVGQRYEFQIWVNHAEDTRFLYGTTVDTAYLSAGDSQLVGQDYVLSALGGFLTGTFTADAAVQHITLREDEVGYVNGFQLRALPGQTVPEPGVLALLALGLAGLAWNRRRAA